MSDEAIAVARGWIEGVRKAFDSGDFDSPIQRFCDPQIEYRPVEEGLCRGHAEVRGNFERWIGTWDEHEIAAEEYLDAGDQVIVALHVRGRGKGSGIEIDARYFQVCTIADGKLTHLEDFTDRPDALRAAGLSEDGGSQP
jgi:ketosteroid isomerase-like protein